MMKRLNCDASITQPTNSYAIEGESWFPLVNSSYTNEKHALELRSQLTHGPQIHPNSATSGHLSDD